MAVEATDSETWKWALGGVTAIMLGLMTTVYKTLDKKVSRLEDSGLQDIWNAIDGLRKADADFSQKILDRLSTIPTREEVRAMLRDTMKGA